ncbi:hypothetical protein SCA6_019235 [Theobroma cacao]
MEIYQVLDFNGSPTDPSDVDAVVAIKHAYNISRDDWQGDPCLPKEYSWNGLNCSVGIGTPRIISLSLSSCNLTGQIPLSLSKLQALESLDLSENDLSGPIPEALWRLPNLKALNLAKEQADRFDSAVSQGQVG